MADGTKICPKCQKIKSLKDYFFQNKAKNKRMSWCKECDKEKKRSYYEKNKKEIINKNMEYYFNNKEINRKSHKKWKEKYLSTEKGKIGNNISRALKKSLKENKNGHWEDIVGYDIKTLVNHLNNGDFKVSDYLNGNYHIDHIIPESLYSYKNIEDFEFKKCWNYRNLRIFPSKDNIIKSNNLNLDLVKKYKIKDLMPSGINF